MGLLMYLNGSKSIIMHRLIPVPNRNIGIYYGLTMAHTAAFVSANWIFFWLRLMTYGQLGLIDAVSFAFGLLMEVPTGAIADLVGKRRTLILAYAFAGIGFIITAAADAAWVLIVGFWFAQIGGALNSGAAEALAFDSLKERGQEAEYTRVAATANMLIGGVMYNIHFRLPHYAWGVVFLLGMVAAFWLREPHVFEMKKFSLAAYRDQLVQGFRQLASPQLRPYLGMIFGALGGMLMFTSGLIQPAIATSFGFLADEQAIVYAVLAFIAALLMPLLPRLRKHISDFVGVAFFTVLLALGFAGAGFPLGAWGFFALLCVRIGGELARTWVSVIVNEHTPSEYRATTLSTVALLVRIPYVLTAIIAGKMVEDGTFAWFNLITATIIVLLVVASFAFRRGLASPAPQPIIQGES
jgi:Major Facilitator Superfamily